MSKLSQPVVICLLLLAAVCVGCATVLIANGDPVPPELWALAFASVTGATGIAVPSAGGSSPPPASGTAATARPTQPAAVAAPPAA